MKKVLKKTVGLLMVVMMIGSMLVYSVSAAEPQAEEAIGLDIEIVGAQEAVAGYAELTLDVLFISYDLELVEAVR